MTATPVERDRFTGQGRTVLILEDDPAIRNAAARILELYEYRVLEAADAHEAIGILERHQGPLDLILCDLVLPGLAGREAANALLARRPGTPVLYTSGYSSRDSFRQDMETSGARFLPKPFEVAELLEAVRAAVAAGHATDEGSAGR